MNAKPRNYPRLRALHNLVDELVRIIQFPKGLNAEYNDWEIIRVIAYAAFENLDIENAAQRLRAMGQHSRRCRIVSKSNIPGEGFLYNLLTTERFES